MRHYNEKGEVGPLTGNAWLSLQRQLGRDNGHVVGPMIVIWRSWIRYQNISNMSSFLLSVIML